MLDPTDRFSDRVDAYVRYRPGYPAGVLDVLRETAGLTPATVVADVGSGTGLSAEPFLRHGNPVLGVEPNAPMRAAAERLLAGYARFHSTDGTAEATTLPDASVSLVVAGQAFHWFRPDDARREFARILAPGGHVALVWNERQLDTTPFLRDYEALIRRFGTDYDAVRHENIGSDRLAAFFAGPYETRAMPNRQTFDLDGLTGRLLSSSYVPDAGHPDRAPMLADLARLFAAHETDGQVHILYDTVVHVGRVA